MNDRLKVAADHGVVHVSLQGKATMMLSIEAVLRAVWTARQSGTRSVLFDLREAESDDYHTRIHKLATEGPRMGIGNYRIAILGLPDDPRLPYIEDVGRNRGYTVKSFTDAEAARAWLLLESRQPPGP